LVSDGSAVNAEEERVGQRERERERDQKHSHQRSTRTAPHQQQKEKTLTKSTPMVLMKLSVKMSSEKRRSRLQEEHHHNTHKHTHAGEITVRSGILTPFLARATTQTNKHNTSAHAERHTRHTESFTRGLSKHVPRQPSRKRTSMQHTHTQHTRSHPSTVVTQT
jgi:hypothetical protein